MKYQSPDQKTVIRILYMPGCNTGQTCAEWEQFISPRSLVDTAYTCFLIPACTDKHKPGKAIGRRAHREKNTGSRKPAHLLGV